MFTFALAAKSLRNRAFTTALTVASIGFSVALLVGIENVRVGIRESFTGTIRGVDLIVGARGGSMQLLLYSVFGVGSPAGNISYDAYARWAAHPAVEWTIPYSLGDSHRGFRVIGTTDAFFEHYRYRNDTPIALAEGERLKALFDVVLGSEVAASLGYKLGDAIAVTHGMGNATGIMDHTDTPFKVTGILKPTYTALDRALYVTLEGVQAMHIGWESGAPPRPGTVTNAAAVRDSVDVDQLTSFFLKTRTRLETLQLQREISTDKSVPLTAVIPGVSLAELWQSIGHAEAGLRIVTVSVVVVGLLGMLVALYTSLAARRREMAILRAVGAGPRRIVGLLVFESSLLSVAGALLGVAIAYAAILIAQNPVEARFGLYIPVRALGSVELFYLAAVVAVGTLIGAVPAYRAYRNTLVDGLSIRV